MIKLKNVTKIYKSKKDNNKILDNINLNLPNKGLIFIVGKKGSGKTTLLNLLGGLDKPTRGDILINNYNISNLKKKEYAYYRNTCVGFVFKENIDDYNIYENITLPLKLQNKKDKDVNRLLEFLGLNNLKKIKTDELTIEEKCKVGIARAVLKQPNIILALNPTDNLDEKASINVLNILKKISKERLVIIFTNDLELALKYSKRVIKLENGRITDNYQNECQEKVNLTFQKAHLPFKYIFSMLKSNFKDRKFKWFKIIFLITTLFTFIEFTLNCTLFKQSDLVINTMMDNKDYVYNVNKVKITSDDNIERLELTNNDLDYIKTNTNSIVNKNYLLYDKEKILTFEFGRNNGKVELYPTTLTKYSEFTEVQDDRLLNNIIGNMPEKTNEIVVHKFFVDYCMKYGIKKVDNTLYFPKNYEDMIKSKVELKLGNNKVIIVGIIDDDNKQFLEVKNKGYFSNSNLKTYVLDNYVRKGSQIFTKGLIDSLTKKDIININNLVINYKDNNITKKLYGVKIYDDNKQNLKNTFEKLFYETTVNQVPGGEQYIFSSDNNYKALANVVSLYKNIYPYILIISLVLVFLTFLEIYRFIKNNILSLKKEIKIMNYLGVNNSDILKIFILEGVIINIVAWILSVIIWYLVCYLLNILLFNQYYVLKGIMINPLIPVILLWGTILINLFIISISIIKINKVNT